MEECSTWNILLVTETTSTYYDIIVAGGGHAGIEAALAQYLDFKSQYSVNTESDLNALGYGLLHSGRIQDAIRVFELNVEEYPDSFNVYDSLGEAYKEAGDRERAIELYRKSLELNPGNTNAVQMLKELGVR